MVTIEQSKGWVQEGGNRQGEEGGMGARGRAGTRAQVESAGGPQGGDKPPPLLW